MKIKQISKKAVLVVAAAALVSSALYAFMSDNSKVRVVIKGNAKNVNYNGSMQSSIGYTVEISSPEYTIEDFVCYAIDSVSATNVGTYSMGISSNDFYNINPKFSDVEFVVEDGYLCINGDMTGNASNQLTVNK